MKCKIIDWAGNEKYNGRIFDNDQVAWDFLTEDQHKQHPDATEDEFDDIMGEFHTQPEAPAKKGKTFADLGRIMLAEVGADACLKSYGTTDPEWVGRYACLTYKDINPDGTLN